MMCTFGNSLAGYCVWDALIGLVVALGIVFIATVHYYYGKRKKELN